MKNFNLTDKGAKFIILSNQFYKFFKNILNEEIKINENFLKSKETFNTYLQDKNNFNIIKNFIINYYTFYSNSFEFDIQQHLSIILKDIDIPFCDLYINYNCDPIPYKLQSNVKGIWKGVNKSLLKKEYHKYDKELNNEMGVNMKKIDSNIEKYKSECDIFCICLINNFTN